MSQTIRQSCLGRLTHNVFISSHTAAWSHEFFSYCQCVWSECPLYPNVLFSSAFFQSLFNFVSKMLFQLFDLGSCFPVSSDSQSIARLSSSLFPLNSHKLSALSKSEGSMGSQQSLSGLWLTPPVYSQLEPRAGLSIDTWGAALEVVCLTGCGESSSSTVILQRLRSTLAGAVLCDFHWNAHAWAAWCLWCFLPLVQAQKEMTSIIKHYVLPSYEPLSLGEANQLQSV